MGIPNRRQWIYPLLYHKERTTKHSFWRHLGNFQNNQGSWKATKKELEDDIDNDLGYIQKRKLTPGGALAAYTTKVLPRLLYKLKHANVPKTIIDKLQTKINGKLKSKLHIQKPTPSLLLHGHAVGGGAAIPHLWDELNKEKFITMQQALLKPGSDLYHVVCGAMHRIHESRGFSLNPVQTRGFTLIHVESR